MSARFGRKVSMLITCIITIVANLLVAFSVSYNMYISMRVLQALGSISCYIAYFTYGIFAKSIYFNSRLQLILFDPVSEMGTLKWKAYINAYAKVAGCLASSILPMLAYFLRDWRNLAISMSIWCTPYLILYFFIPRSPRWVQIYLIS